MQRIIRQLAGRMAIAKDHSARRSAVGYHEEKPYSAKEARSAIRKRFHSAERHAVGYTEGEVGFGKEIRGNRRRPKRFRSRLDAYLSKYCHVIVIS